MNIRFKFTGYKSHSFCMKKPSILLVISILWVFASRAQNITDKEQTVIGSFTGSVAKTTDLPFFASSFDAEQIVASIMDVMGLESTFKIKIANVPNVEAAMRHHERYILYNPEFVDNVNKVTKNKWASIFILAHEVGHHLEGHTAANIKSRPDIELQADEFAGFVLCKMGATLQDAQLAMHYISNIAASKTHPGRFDRLVAIEKGWDKAEAQLTSTSQK
jgi:hypothetical protein